VNPRTVAILLVLALLLGGYVYFGEIVGGEKRREAEEQSQRLFPGLEAQDIEAIWLYAGHGVTRVEREDGGWTLIAPVEFPGDDIVLDGIASALAQLTRETVIEEPQAPGVYGLGADSSVIYFTAKGTDSGLRLGSTTPVGDAQYVVPASFDPLDKVFTVASWRINAIQKDLDDIRDKRVLDFDRDAVDQVRVSWPEGSVDLLRASDGWRVKAPVDDLADASTVDRLLSDLAFMRAEGFEDAPQPDNHTGLDRPALVFELRLGVGMEGEDEDEIPRRRLEIGSFPVGQFALARAAHESLYKINLERIDDFPRTVVAYRDKDLTTFDPSEADELEIHFSADDDGEPVVVKARKGEDGWDGGERNLAPERLNSLLDELSHLKGDDIVAEQLGKDELAGLGFDPPRVTLVVLGRRSTEGFGVRLAELELGIADPDRGILARPPKGRKIYRLDWDRAEYLPVSQEAFDARFVVHDDNDGAGEEVLDPTASSDLGGAGGQ
jgi:hypothetical protein